MEAKFKMVDLCAGTGAFSYAFQNSVDVVFSNDISPHSKTIYDANFSHKLTLKNLNDILVESIPSHDILTGGFPCQPFSIGGRREGFADQRSNVFWNIIAIMKHHKPMCVILENVKHVLGHDEGKTLKTIVSSIEAEGYHVRYKILNTAALTGIPHHRERVYFVCVRSKDVYDKFNLEFPAIEKNKLADYFETSVDKKYYYNESTNKYDVVNSAVVNTETMYQFRRIYVRENKKNECPCLTAVMGGVGSATPILRDALGVRRLTPRECFNFQGFPASYVLPNINDNHLYKLAGNAISLPIAQLIANRLMPLLVNKDG